MGGTPLTEPAKGSKRSRTSMDADAISENGSCSTNKNDLYAHRAVDMASPALKKTAANRANLSVPIVLDGHAEGKNAGCSNGGTSSATSRESGMSQPAKPKRRHPKRQPLRKPLPQCLHRCNLVTQLPAAVNLIAVVPNRQSHLAIARDDGTIEIRKDSRHRWQTSRKFRTNGGNVQAMLWVRRIETRTTFDDENDVEDDNDINDNGSDDPEENAIMSADNEEQEKETEEDRRESPNDNEAASASQLQTSLRDEEDEDAIFAEHRLLTASADGQLQEWDLQKLCVAKSIPLTSAIWSMAVSPSHTTLAVGCQDGRIHLFDLRGGACEYIRATPEQKHRITALSFINEEELAIGTSGNRLYIASLYGVQRFAMPLQSRDTIVWSLECIGKELLGISHPLSCSSSHTIVTGDSTGRTSFWDVRTGTLLTAHQTNGADVLSVCADTNDGVYAAGVDNTLVYLRLLENEWSIVWRRRIHTHDIRAVAICKESIVTGSVDCSVHIGTLASFQKNDVGTRLRQWEDCVQFSQESGWLLHWDRHHARIWQLAKARTDGEAVAENATQIAELQLPKAPVVGGSMSASGEHLAILHPHALRIFQVISHARSGGPTQIKRIRTIPVPRAGISQQDRLAQNVALLPDGGMCLRVLHATPDLPSLVEAIDVASGMTLGTFSFPPASACQSLQVTSDGRYAILLDTRGSVHLWRLDRFKAMVIADLPRIAHVGLLSATTLLLVDGANRQWQYDITSHQCRLQNGKAALRVSAAIQSIAPGGLLIGDSFVYDHQNDHLLTARTHLRTQKGSTILTCERHVRDGQEVVILVEELLCRREQLLPGAFDHNKFAT